MAAMDQGKLSRMCSSINNTASDYVTQVGNSVTELTNAFNENWISNSSKDLANEITECLNTLATSITDTFSSKNESIKVSVNNFNSVEAENISYPGFAFGKPNTTLNLAAALPNGKVGVADGADIGTINDPMKRMVERITSLLDNIVNTVRGADAFDVEEQTALTTAVSNIKAKFEAGMQELENSLATRMSNEISVRDQLNATNKSNLEG